MRFNQKANKNLLATPTCQLFCFQITSTSALLLENSAEVFQNVNSFSLLKY